MKHQVMGWPNMSLPWNRLILSVSVAATNVSVHLPCDTSVVTWRHSYSSWHCKSVTKSVSPSTLTLLSVTLDIINLPPYNCLHELLLSGITRWRNEHSGNCKHRRKTTNCKSMLHEHDLFWQPTFDGVKMGNCLLAKFFYKLSILIYKGRLSERQEVHANILYLLYLLYQLAVAVSCKQCSWTYFSTSKGLTNSMLWWTATLSIGEWVWDYISPKSHQKRLASYGTSRYEMYRLNRQYVSY